jgi:KAP family P-loop domain/Sulfatase-modifying factor enzyme 1
MTDTTTKDDGDWLGYGVYADTLWARIVRALDKDDLGDDPLVIGLFGEWGAGKSYLLNLMQDEAKSWAKDRIGMRKQLGGDGVVLTVPVLFQPWKYEYEAHLLVPMMLHILYTLQEYTSKARTNWDKAGGVTEIAWEGVKKSMPKVVSLFEKATKGAIAAMEPNTAIAAGIGLGAAKSAAGLLKPREDNPNLHKNYKNSDDGRFFYELHQTLKDVTRPKRENGLLKEHFNYPFRLNFVVFIDDLDRCLPEKAVQTLEMIKTIFNVDSFAFVLALDDEVIERGIGHRYQAYNFAGKKPEMPITGFEYLEKIVHLPFKLPALTQTQAKKFIENLEKKLAPDAPSQFVRKVIENPADNRMRHFEPEEAAKFDVLDESAKNLKRAFLHDAEVFDLLELTLSAFDAYVPRKLTRLVELWHNTVDIAKKRHDAEPKKELIELKINSQIDARIAFTIMLVQLFHPDLYRVFRRHEQTFKTFYDSFVPGGLSESISDIDLWRWAAFTKNVNANKKSYDLSSDKPKIVEEKATDLKSTLQAIAKLDDGYRFPAQQKRLPLVERLIEHRAAQRHVFDALKLFAALKKQMPALPDDFKIAQYFSLLSEFDEVLTPLALPQVAAPVSESSTKRGFKVKVFKRFDTDANLLYNSVISADEGMQEAIPTLVGFDPGYYVSADVLKSVFKRVKAWINEDGNPEDKSRREQQLLRGLTHLACYIAPTDCKAVWELVKDSVDFSGSFDPKLCTQWYDVRAALGQDPRFKDYLALTKRKEGDADEAPAGYVLCPPIKYVFGDEGKTRTQTKTFYISRYAVTVAQYAAFVDADNYNDQKLWEASHKEAWRWRTGEFDSSKTIENKDNNDWLARRSVNLRHEPMDWAEQKANPNRPVTGVTWFESTVYAAWLEQQRQVRTASKADADLWGNLSNPDYRLRLPTEGEWERAARAGGTDKFPWGDDEADIDRRANVNDKVSQPTTVGSYPAKRAGLVRHGGQCVGMAG